LGHGERAAEATRAALDVLHSSATEPLEQMIERCHRALRGTRGVVASLATVHASGLLRWAGVGNVEAILFRAGGQGRESIVPRPGVLGYQLPDTLLVRSFAIAQGDLLVLATDGVAGEFAGKRDFLHYSPQSVAENILARWAGGTDDALVLAARYRGSGSSI
jgi:hypothetical protein